MSYPPPSSHHNHNHKTLPEAPKKPRPSVTRDQYRIQQSTIIISSWSTALFRTPHHITLRRNRHPRRYAYSPPPPLFFSCFLSPLPPPLPTLRTTPQPHHILLATPLSCLVLSCLTQSPQTKKKKRGRGGGWASPLPLSALINILLRVRVRAWRQCKSAVFD